MRQITLLLITLLLLTPARTPHAAPRASPAYDTPLPAANMCGAGEPGDVHFTLAATGDTFPHENIQAVGEAQGYDQLFDYLRPFLKAADLAYTNFDGAMLAGSPYTGYPAFNYNPALATALKNAGIGLVSTANNHILDRGPEGLDATLAVLERSGILQHGAVTSSAAGQPHPPYLPITLNRDGVSLKVGFISATWGTNGIPDPYGQVNLLYASNTYGSQGGVRQEILDAIALARRESDIVVVAAHWGFEYQFYPDASQEEAARLMAAAGADVILGAQPHTLQPTDIIKTEGRRTLVIYSLANFLASQGAFQASSYSATSIIFYVGLVRHADGSVDVTGYRYLPTIHIDGDTRPAPIAAGTLPEVVSHVRLKLRDPGGRFEVSPDPAALGERIEVCPPLRFAEAPERPVPGDFAQHYLTLGGGATPYPPAEALAVFGYPLGPVVREPAGDCVTMVDVLYTERQRLELRPGEDWPFRVVGTQLGTAAFERKYGVGEIRRRTDLAAADAFANERFRAFYERHGGLAVFGYPISGALTESDRTSGAPRSVQYFERARFELAPDGSDTVLLGLLGREYPGIAAQCSLEGLPIPALPIDTQGQPPTGGSLAIGAAQRAVDGGRDWWLWLLVGLGALLIGLTVLWLLQIATRPRAYARVQARRSARERLRID